MFFQLSKVFWFFANPGNLILVALAVGVVLTWTRWRRAGLRLVTLVALTSLAVATVPVGNWMKAALENRFPVVRKLPNRVDGIIALGGVVNPWVTKARGQLALGSAAERLTEFAVLARRYPRAKLIFTGGSGSLLHPEAKEADVLEPMIGVLGLDPRRIVLENRSRNTHENAVFTRRLADPQPGETWVLVTTASHMPRAVGCFRKAGWRVVPYPVDFDFRGDEEFGLNFNFIGGLARLSDALHEWLGLTFYWLAGKTDALFPAPDD